jgi:hypothetical protein
MFYFNQFLHNLSNNFFKNLILIRFEGIEDNYLYVYLKKSFKILKYEFLFTFHSEMKPHDTKRQVATQKNKFIHGHN